MAAIIEEAIFTALEFYFLLIRMIKQKPNQGLMERVISGFKKTIAIGAFALTGMMNQGCMSEARLEREVFNSFTAQGRKNMYEGNVDEGIEYLKKAERIRELDASDSYQLGMAYKEKKDFSNAIEYLKKATERRIKNFHGDKEKFRANTFFELANVYLEINQNKEKAVECLEEAVELDEENREYKNLLIKLRGITYIGLTAGLNQKYETSFGFEVISNNSGEDKSFVGGTFLTFKEMQEFGLSALMFYKVHNNILVGGGAGFFLRSEESEETEFLFTYSADIKFINNYGFFSIGYNNLRGIAIGFGAGL